MRPHAGLRGTGLPLFPGRPGDGKRVAAGALCVWAGPGWQGPGQASLQPGYFVVVAAGAGQGALSMLARQGMAPGVCSGSATGTLLDKNLCLCHVLADKPVSVAGPGIEQGFGGFLGCLWPARAGLSDARRPVSASPPVCGFPVRAGAGLCMKSAMPAEGDALGKGLSTVLMRADKGLGACMDPLVCVQGAALPEAFATAFEEAGKGSGSCMDPPVFVQGTALCEGFATARIDADKGSFAGMGPDVLLQDTALPEGFVTVRIGAGKGPLPGRNPPVG